MPGVQLNRRGFIVSATCLVSTTAGMAVAGTDFDQKPASVISADPQHPQDIGQAPVQGPNRAPAQALNPPQPATVVAEQPAPAATPQTATAEQPAPAATPQTATAEQPAPAATPQTATADQPAPAAAQAKTEPAPTRTAEAKPADETTLPMPKGKVILSISGKISMTNVGNTARFDRQMLENLGMTSFTTTTPWYNAPVTFEGVRLDRLMKVVGASGELLRARALDDYTTEIPITDFEHYETILAMKRDGNYMPVTDKGPLFIVYPFDSNPDLKHQRFYARSAWQVARMIVT